MVNDVKIMENRLVFPTDRGSRQKLCGFLMFYICWNCCPLSGLCSFYLGMVQPQAARRGPKREELVSGNARMPNPMRYCHISFSSNDLPQTPPGSGRCQNGPGKLPCAMPFFQGGRSDLCPHRLQQGRGRSPDAPHELQSTGLLNPWWSVDPCGPQPPLESARCQGGPWQLPDAEELTQTHLAGRSLHQPQPEDVQHPNALDLIKDPPKESTKYSCSIL